MVSVHTKSDKSRLNNYRPVSLPPIRSKILVRLIFNEIFGFFIENLGTLASINFYQLLAKYTNDLIKILMLVVYFPTRLRPMIKYGTMVLFSN